MMKVTRALSDYELNHRGLGHRGTIKKGIEANDSVVALKAPGNMLADLGQFPEQAENMESIEIRKILSSSEPEKGMYDDVLVTPAYMEFKDASEGTIFRKTMTIRNIGKVPAYVKICPPNSIALKIKSLKKNVMLSPGLALVRTVTYTFKRPALLHATIPLVINGHQIEYHIICSFSTEYITIRPSVIDFGIVDIGCSSGTAVITISNIGGKSTRFTIDLGKNSMEINVKPRRGIVRPRSNVQLQVEMIGITEGVFYSEFWIKSNPNIRVPMRVKVIVPRLVILYPNTTGDFTLMDFPMTYVNTRRYDTLVLKNVSSQFSSFVVLGEIDDELVPIQDINKKDHPAYNVFKIRPVQGRLEPFQGTIFVIEFAPTKGDVVRNSRDRKSDRRQDFMAVVRILRVHCREAEDIMRPVVVPEPSADFPGPQKVQIQEEVKSNSSNDEEEISILSGDQTKSIETVRLCIHGETEAPRLNFTPKELYLHNFEAYEKADRVVEVENPLNSGSLIFRFVANAKAHCEPSEALLGPGKSLQVLVQIGGEKIRYVEPKVRLAFDVVVKEQCFWPSTKFTDVKVATFYVDCHIMYKRSTKTVMKKPLVLSEPEIARTKHREYWADYLRTQERRVEKKADSEQLKKMSEAWEETVNHDEPLIPKIKNIEPVLNVTSLCESTKITIPSEVHNNAKTLMSLSPLQIYNVKVSPTMFTFGMVVAKSVNFQELKIENRNNFPVMMKLISLSSKNIRFPDGDSMLVKPGCSVAKLVEFRADQIGKFNSYIDYVINENHSFELTITADVAYKFLSLGARMLVLGGPDQYLPGEYYRPLVGYIEIKNKLNARTNFKWDVPTSASYTIDPLAGSVRGKRNLFVSVNYDQDVLKTQNTEVILVTEGGVYMTLKLSTILPVRPNVFFINDTLNVDEIPLNVPYTALAVIHNAEYTRVFFELDEKCLPHGWQVYPKRGCISPRGIAPIQIVMRFEVCLHFTITIKMIVQRCHATRLRVTGRVSFPILKLAPSKIEMKRISLDATQLHLLTVTNIGKTMATVRFPLHDYPEFRVSIFDPSTVQQHSEIAFETTTTQDKDTGMIVLPGSARTFCLHFTPVDLASYQFHLPIIINEILGPVVMQNPNSSKPDEYVFSKETYYRNLSNITLIKAPQTELPKISIDCIVTGHVLSFSKLLFNFDTSIDKAEDILRISNNTTEERSFVIRTDQLQQKSSAFRIDWDNRGVPVEFMGTASIVCTLESNSDTYLRITFHPEHRHGNFIVEAPIFVRGQLDGAMFNMLKLQGRNPKSRIESDIREIYLCPIPLRIEAKEVFEIWTCHFSKNARIKGRITKAEKLVGEFKNDLLTVTFPRGNNVEAVRCKKKGEPIEVRVSFISSTPVSFCTKLELFDTENLATLVINVFATADNCLLTIHNYLMSSGDPERLNKYDFPPSENISNDSEISENCLMEKQVSRGGQKSAIDGIPMLSVHSTTSQSSWNAARILSRLRVKSQNLKESLNNDEQGEEDEERELVSMFEESKVSVVHTIRSLKQLQNSKLHFPIFSTRTRASPYEHYMQRTLKVAEQWLYSGPLRYQFYPHLVDGITASFSNLYNVQTLTSDKRKAGGINQSFIDILAILVGPELYDFIGVSRSSAMPEDNVERILFVLKIYGNMLKFLIAQGACLCHVPARYLLNYSDYEMALDHQTFMQLSNKTGFDNDLGFSETMRSHHFEARSKECWLDVILQTFKSLVLKKITVDGLRARLSDNMELRSIDKFRSESTLSFCNVLSDDSIIKIEGRSRGKKIYSEQESLLLAWLEYHYEQQRQERWLMDERVFLNPLEGKDVAQERVITNFEDDLADSLVLMAVTVAYCPFLINESFRNIYICPRSAEEVLHNGICVVAAWEKIRLGFIITAQEIVQPNPVQMLMLIAHLFQTLPTYIPRAKVRFSCPLTETVTRSLSLTNPTGSRVSYVVQFFGNNAGFFNVCLDRILKLDMYQNSTIKIEYHARKFQKTRAYLIFCGGALGPAFARNQCFVLVGNTSHLGIVDEYKIKSKLYSVVDKTLRIRVPYKYATEYEIWMTEDMPMKPNTIKMERWAELSLRKIPRRLFLNQKSISVLQDAYKADLSITVACIAPNARNFWIILQSKLGDFIIQINSSSQASITDHLIVNWERNSCICADPSNIVGTCPLNISIGIPPKNYQLWNCVSQMLKKSLNPKESLFWSRNIASKIGLRLIQRLMEDYKDSTAQEFAQIFDLCTTYNVSTSGESNFIVLPEKFTIPDVIPSAEEDIPMQIHVDEFLPPVYETTISLLSLDERENRVYTVEFLCKTPIPSQNIAG